jgi:carbamoylphosphate synthase large subunit
VIPLSDLDYDLIKDIFQKLDINNIKIVYPTKETISLLHNKNHFTNFMLTKYIGYIPDIYYLDNKKLKDIEYPAIYKPTYSTNGKGMCIIYNDDDFLRLRNHNNIQQFVANKYEYAALMLCIDGHIINYKILRHRYRKYNIKKTNFPDISEHIEDFNITVFRDIIKELNYSGGVCIDFKFDEKTDKIYIFEINPRFGGSAFTLNFIGELLCINK